MDVNFLNQIVGEKLSAVVFVLDYHQLQFDGPSITILNPISIIFSGGRVIVGEDQFRNRLCEQIGKVVSQVDCQESQSLDIEFEDGSKITISLKDCDYKSPEAIIYNGEGNQCAVI